jgi:hypothetical protein
LHYKSLLISVLFLITSCTGGNQQHEEPVATDPTAQYEYQVGLGYGFLGKAVQVTVDDREVISIIGTEEIENHAQLLGTKMFMSGFSPNKDIIVRVTIDGDQIHEQAIDLSAGMYIHIYFEQTGLLIFNTHYLVQE